MTDETRPLAEFRQARAAEVAARQWGSDHDRAARGDRVLARARSTGWPRRGLLQRLHRGVYGFGALSPAPEQRWAAALLAAGDGSALSHTTRRRRIGQLPVREVIEVTAPTQRRGDERAACASAASESTVTTHRGLTVTTPAQTLLDLAAIGWPIDRMTHDLRCALARSLSMPCARSRATGAASRAPQRWPKALNLPHTRSALGAARSSDGSRRIDGDPGIPEMNDPIGHLTVDCHWPEHDLVIELDTEQTHGNRLEAARRRAARRLSSRAAGNEVWRVAHRRPGDPATAGRAPAP